MKNVGLFFFEVSLPHNSTDTFNTTTCFGGDRGNTVVKLLCYKSEGRWLDSRWCHWNFSLT